MYANDQDESSKVYGLEQSVTYLSKSITKTINPLPDYHVGKPDSPIYSIPRGNRFEIEKNYAVPGPDTYFTDSQNIKQDFKMNDLKYNICQIYLPFLKK